MRALVGGRDYALAPFNRATLAMRQPGSSFKPFVYAKALEDSLSAATIVPDTALAIRLDNGRVYSPDNSDGKFLGPITMREALIHSRNPVAVQLALRVGLDSMVAIAHRGGIATPDRRGAGERARRVGRASARLRGRVHGVGEPRQHRRAAARHAHRGRERARRCCSVPPSAPQSVIDPRIAFIVRDMMRDAAERGTGAPARRAVPANIPVAGKTGTTNDNVDVWFMGMTPDLVAGVWLGFDRPKTIAPGVAGGSLAAPIWGEMMAKYYAGRPVPPAWVAAARPGHRGARPRDRPARRRHDAARAALHRVLHPGHRARAAAQHAVEARRCSAR